RARGRMAHGAMPEAGLNPIGALGAILREGTALARRLRKRSTPSRYLRPPTVTPTIVEGPPRAVGIPQPNVIPALAEVTLDVRLGTGIDADAVRAELEELCANVGAAHAGLKVEWEAVNPIRLATRVERSEPLVQAMVRGVRAATGRAPRY